MRLRAVCGGLVVLALAGCGHSGPVFDSVTYPSERVSASVAQVSFRDRRPGVVTESFDTPLMSLPGETESKAVAVSRGTEDEVRRRLARLIGGGGEALNVEIEIESGDAGWKASWTTETAHARVALRITFRRATTAAVLLTASGEAWGRRSSLDVSDREPGELFQAAVLAAFDRAVAKSAVVEALSAALRGDPASNRS